MAKKINELDLTDDIPTIIEALRIAEVTTWQVSVDPMIQKKYRKLASKLSGEYGDLAVVLEDLILGKPEEA